MKQETAPRSLRLTADQRIWNLGYSRGYGEGRLDGLMEGGEDFQSWLLEELATLAQDVRLGLRSDLATPLQVLAQVIELVKEGQPVEAPADDAQWEEETTRC